MSSDVQICAVLCCVETTTESDDLRLLCTKFNMLSLGFCPSQIYTVWKKGRK